MNEIKWDKLIERDTYEGRALLWEENTYPRGHEAGVRLLVLGLWWVSLYLNIELWESCKMISGCSQLLIIDSLQGHGEEFSGDRECHKKPLQSWNRKATLFVVYFETRGCPVQAQNLCYNMPWVYTAYLLCAEIQTKASHVVLVVKNHPAMQEA